MSAERAELRFSSGFPLSKKIKNAKIGSALCGAALTITTRMNSTQKEQIRSIVRRGLLALLSCTAIYLSAIAFFILDKKVDLPIENCTELYQEALLLATAVLCYRMAGERTRERGGLLLMAGFFTCLFIRELDAWFDCLYHGAWAHIALVYLLGLFGYLFKSRAWDSTVTGLYRFSQSNAFFMMVAGVTFLIVFSRLFGSQFLWDFYLLPKAATRAKRLAEEGTELIGYIFMLYAMVSYMIERAREGKEN